MSRGTHWWNEPPLWAWIAMVVGAVSLAVLLPIALQRTAPVDVGTPPPATSSDAEASPGDAEPSLSAEPTTTAPGSSTAPATTSAAEGARVVVVGDGDSAGDTAWPVLLDDDLDDVEFEVAADVGAGYVTAGAEGETLPGLAEQADLADADVVVVFGSRNDPAGVADEVAVAARGLFGSLADRAPDAQLLVIGPPWFSEPVPAGVRNNRDVIREAAETAEATFVDPLAERWFVDRSDLLTDTGNPSVAGHAYLARLIEPEVRGLLPG